MVRGVDPGGRGANISFCPRPPPQTIKFNLKILLNIHNFQFCGALRAQNLISEMCALSAPKILTFLTFAPPPLIRKTDRRPCLWYGAIYTILYWQDTKIKRNLWMCERASFKILTFSQSKTVISFIILLVLQILSLRHIYFQVSNNICIHINNQCTFLISLMVWCYI